MVQARFEIAGTRYRQADFAQAQVKIGDMLRMTPEPSNVFDSNAIAVFKDNFHIGYVPRNENKELLPHVAAGKITCVVEAATPHSCWVLVEMP